MTQRITLNFICLVCFAILQSCNQDRKLGNENSVSTVSSYLEYYNDKEMMDSLFNLVKTKGDTLAYINLHQIYSLSGHREDFLYISLFMANKYKYKQAYFDVYKNLNTLEKVIRSNSQDSIADKKLLDYETENLKGNYLVKAHEKGRNNATKVLGEK